MKKITTLYKKDIDDLSRVTREIDPENEWVYITGIPTRKFDGTACAIIGGILYKRYDVKKGRTVPVDSIPCDKLPDVNTGHWPHWVPCDKGKPEDKYFFEAFDDMNYSDGTYELCGPKVQRNPEKFISHTLIRHGVYILEITDFSYDAIEKYLSRNDIEGIVFHEEGSDRMCKIRKCDFGIRRL